MLSTLTLIAAMLGQIPAPNVAARVARELRAEREKLAADERADLESIAIEFEKSNDAVSARAARAPLELRSETNGPSRFDPLPEVISPQDHARAAQTSGLASVATKEAPGAKPSTIAAEVGSSRADYAGRFLALARRAATASPHQFALADDCLRRALRLQPDHPEVRRLLGYVPYNGGWATPFAKHKLDTGYVLDPNYGWVEQTWLPRLKAGELPIPPAARGGKIRWRPADDANRVRSDWDNAWTISTEHFFIKTNVTLQNAIRFGHMLEDFHDVFQALTADVIDDRLPLARRFADPKAVGEGPGSTRHEVYYFATRREFIDFLRPVQGDSIEKSLGLYLPPTGRAKRGRAYFFHDPDGEIDSTSTLFHEVSHQLLCESGVIPAYERNAGHYWVIEGLGTYFETFTIRPDGVLEVGGPVGPRMARARLRIIQRGEYVSIEQLAAMRHKAFNVEPDIYLHYAESMALTAFFMQARDGAYRYGYLAYARDVVRGRVKPGGARTLDDRLGVPYKTLDAEFLAYLKEAVPDQEEVRRPAVKE